MWNTLQGGNEPIQLLEYIEKYIEKYLIFNSTLGKLKLNFQSRHTDMEKKIMVKPKGKGVGEGQIRSL